MRMRVQLTIELEAPARLMTVADILMDLGAKLMFDGEEDSILELASREIEVNGERLGAYTVIVVADTDPDPAIAA